MDMMSCRSDQMHIKPIVSLTHQNTNYKFNLNCNVFDSTNTMLCMGFIVHIKILFYYKLQNYENFIVTILQIKKFTEVMRQIKSRIHDGRLGVECQ